MTVEMTAVPQVMGAEADETMATRLAPWADVKPEYQGMFLLEEPVTVTVTSVCYEGNLDRISQQAKLEQIDRSDPRRTFYVRFDETDSMWVHDVAKVVSDDGPTLDPALVEARDQIARLQERLQEQRRETATVRAEYGQFKVNVREIAIREVPEHWCKEGCNEILAELGLDPMQEPMVEFVVLQRIRVRARPVNRSIDDMSESWIESSISSIDGDEVTMDSDWEDEEIVDSDLSVEEYEAVED